MNNPANEKYVKAFVGHKPITDDDVIEIAEARLDNSLTGVVKKWVERSKEIAKFRQKGEDGIFYGNRAAIALLDGTDGLAQQLGVTIGNGTGEYRLFREVELWVDRGKNQNMRADILRVKFDRTEIEDVIIIETKLSVATDYTSRQKQGWREISLTGLLQVKSQKINSVVVTDANGERVIRQATATNGTTLDRETILQIDKAKAIKIYGDGTASGNFNRSVIPVERWDNYVPPIED